MRLRTSIIQGPGNLNAVQFVDFFLVDDDTVVFWRRAFGAVVPPCVQVTVDLARVVRVELFTQVAKRLVRNLLVA